jgi:tungstate transport system substrate-binding protein
MKAKCVLLFFVITGLFTAGSGCTSKSTPSITLATTTSVQDTGLLDDLLPLFHEQTGIEVRVVAVGTGQALELGRRGDADVLMVHDAASEKQFMDDGFGSSRTEVMYNDFLLVGPPNDPAGIKGEKSIVEAFRKLADKDALFVSRGDDSGTHKREKSIWKQLKLEPKGQWYVEAGSGMASVLRMADQKKAYTLCDRGTYLALHQGMDMQIIVAGDPVLINHYSVIVVNPAKHPHVHHDLAKQFADFLISPATQKRIGEFGVAQFGHPLFIPDAGSPQQ